MRIENKQGSRTKTGLAKIPVNFLVIFLICSFFLIGCNGEPDTTFEDQNKAAWQACIDTGGVPIRSNWSTQMSDCRYK